MQNLYSHLNLITTSPVKWQLLDIFGDFIGPTRLNIGCAGNKESGFINLDMDPRTGAEIVCQLGVDPIPVPDSTFDTILASHVMEHIPRASMFPIMLELYRVLKPGGHLIAITPYGSSDDAWDNPHHIQCFTENTWAYFSRRLYEVPGSAGFHAYEGQQYADWVISASGLVPYPEFKDDPKLAWKTRHLRNIIQELHVVLTAVKGSDTKGVGR